MSSLSSDALAGRSPEQIEATLSQVKDLVTGDQPLMTDPPDAHVILFRGLYLQGNWHQEAMVKELTGADEEAIARMQGGTQTSPGQFLNGMLAFGVASLASFDLPAMTLQERFALLDQLLVGEKELLFLNILRVTYGDQRSVSVRCMECAAINEVSFLISTDIPIRSMDDPFRTTYEYTCRNGSHIEYRLVTGADQAEVAKKTNASIPEQNTIIFSRCITTLNGKPIVDPLHFARGMSAFDRRLLLAAMNESQPGPYFEEVKLPCATCGAESTFTPQWADLLPS
jgi:hypothetical protein